MPAETPATTSACTNTVGQPKPQRDPRAQMPADHGRRRVRAHGHAHAQADGRSSHRHCRVALVEAASLLGDAVDDVTHRRQPLGPQEPHDAGHEEAGQREDRARSTRRPTGQGPAAARRCTTCPTQVDGLVEQPHPDRGHAAEGERDRPQPDMAPEGQPSMAGLNARWSRRHGRTDAASPSASAASQPAGPRPGCPAPPRHRTWSPCP